MRERKYYLALDNYERNVIINSLKEHRKIAYINLLTEQMKQAQGITEQLKAKKCCLLLLFSAFL